MEKDGKEHTNSILVLLTRLKKGKTIIEGTWMFKILHALTYTITHMLGETYFALIDDCSTLF